MLNVTWIKLTTGDWCPFQTVNLNGVAAQGVYIIWHAGNPSRVVYVGQGDIASRLRSHRTRPDINGYARYGSLYVTWASVPASQQDGVERYLADKWSPLVGDAHPDVLPIAVNTPW